MTYSIVGILGIIICLIINGNIIFVKNPKKLNKATRIYRGFLFSIIVFFVADSVWGLFYDYHLVIPLIIDTSVYFFAMASSILFWAAYASIYLKQSKVMKITFSSIGLAVFLFSITVVIINFFTPILFKVDSECQYSALFLRYVLLSLQVALFFIVALYSFIRSFMTSNKEIRNRYLGIALFGLLVGVAITLQVLYPLLPLYAVGSIIGICIIHELVQGGEKREFQDKLASAFIYERKQKEDLVKARILLYKDSLTKAKSRHAYVVLEEKIDELISKNEINEFAVVVFDINGLKKINDTKGHKFGDDYINSCYLEIAKVYKDVPVYRFGGDEFVVFLRGETYKKKDELLKAFEDKIDRNIQNGSVSISSGMAVFDRDDDSTLRSVFIKADNMMYKRKRILERKGMND